MTLYSELQEKGYEKFIQTLNIINTFEARSPSNMIPLIIDSFYKIEMEQSRVGHIMMSAKTYPIIKKLRNFEKQHFEEVVDKNLSQHGVRAYLWGAVIYEANIPDNKILTISDIDSTAVILTLDKIIFNKEKYPHLFEKEELNEQA